jgi:hypothetical protein
LVFRFALTTSAATGYRGLLYLRPHCAFSNADIGYSAPCGVKNHEDNSKLQSHFQRKWGAKV